MLKVAIIGCGKIADLHATQIQRIKGCELVAVCDREELMAKQLQERFDIRARFTKVPALLEKAKPDVVHITTPPQSQYALGKLCLENGSHVYIEKPFTVNAQQAEALIDLAEQQSLKLTVGHNMQFSHAAIRMRELIGKGYLGGPPVHLDSYYCYDLGDISYAKSLLSDPHHWVRDLPGGLLQNNISHGISKIAEFLTGDFPTVIAYGYTSPFLQSIGETNIIDELRVIIHDDNNKTTAHFTFSSQMRPLLHQIRLYGPRNGLIVDDDQQLVVKLKGQQYKSYLEQFVPPWVFAKQFIGNFFFNVKKFIESDFHTSHGMKILIQNFYNAISNGDVLPIPYKEILLTTRIMDEIFRQLYPTSTSINVRESNSTLIKHS